MPQVFQTQAAITASPRIMPGVTMVRLTAPEIASRARPGQFVLARCGEGDDPYLRRPLPLFEIGDREIALLVRADEPGRRWLARQPLGQAIDVLGPLGKGFTLSSVTRHLLLVAEGMGIAALGPLAALAGDGLAVTLLAGAPTAATALPADLLPPAVEYRLATADGSLGARGNVAALLPDVIPWADQVCAAGPPALYRALAEAIARFRLAAEEDFAQVWLLGPVACGLGTCLACAVPTRRGLALSCREGPVFRLAEVDTG